METVIYLDTHVVTWLFAGRLNLLSRRALDVLEEKQVIISPMVRLELEYLYEIGRVATTSGEVVGDLMRRIGLGICDLPFDLVITQANGENWTRDPFDRIIVAQAAAREESLLTKDEDIHDHYARAVW